MKLHISQIAEKFKFKNPFSKKKLIIFGVIFIVLIGGIFTVTKFAANKKALSNATTQRTSTAKMGNIKVSVSGSGTIYYNNTYDATSTVASTVKKLYFKEGDTVKAGDLIAELDDSNAVDSFNTSRNNYLQNQMTNNETIKNVSKLIVKSPFSGQASNILVKLGDEIQAGAKLFTLTDTSKLKVTVPFNTEDAAKLSVGQTVGVYITSFMQSIDGNITFISNQPTATQAGGQLTNVEVVLNNPGALLSGMTASVEASTAQGEVSSIQAAALEYINQKVVTSEVGGTVKALSVKDGQKINSGDAVVSLENDDVIRSKDLAVLKNQNLETDFQSAQKKLDDYKIYAEIDGVISEQKFKVGDNVKSGDVIATITDTSGLYFDIPIDELDVAKIEIGQKAEISVDALEETEKKPLTGEVTKIAFKGTSSNGVASFPVTVKIDGINEKIKGSMNANAEILITNVENVLMVPVDAISKENGKSYVWIKNGQGANGSGPQGKTENAPKAQTNESSQNKVSMQGAVRTGQNTNKNSQNANKALGQQNYYVGAVKTEVTTGVNNASFIEIKSGLKAGDIVVLPQQKTSTNNLMQNPQGMGGMGAPSGGATAPVGGGNTTGGTGAQGAGGRR